MYCPRCGAENPDNKTLCVRCRKPLAIRLQADAASASPSSGEAVRFSCSTLAP